MRRALHLMGSLDDNDIEWLIASGSRHFKPRETVLIQEGLPMESLFILLDGRLVVRLEARGNKAISWLRSGEIVGEISFVDSRPPSASVIADQDSHVLEVPKALVQEKLNKDQGFAARFYRAIAVFLAERMRATVSQLGYGSSAGDAAGFAVDELDDTRMEDVSQAAQRFDRLLKAVQRQSTPKAWAAGGEY